MKLQISTEQLSLGLQGDDVARLHQALIALGRDLPQLETDKQVVGAGTVAIVKAVQAASGLEASGVVDAKTVDAINVALAAGDEAKRIVRGRVLTADGKPPADTGVQVYLQAPGGEKAVGKAAVGADGGYEVAYQPNSKLTRIDLRVEVRGPRTALETIPPGTSILTDAAPLEVLDFTVAGKDSAPLPEMAGVLASIQPLIGSTTPDKLTEVSLLGLQSGRAPAQVAALAIASRIAGSTKIPPEVFYALQRQGLPADLDSLRATNPEVIKGALAAAVADGTVPAIVGDQKIENYLPALAPVPDARLNKLLGNILQPAELTRLADIHAAQGADPATFWKAVGADSVFAGRADRLKLATQVAGLTESHEPLVNKILARADIKAAADLATLSADQWKVLVQAGDVGVPPNIPGTTPAEKADNYVADIVNRAEAAFPTQFFAARLGNAPVGKFLAANSAFDLKTTSLTKFLKDNPSATLTPADCKQLQTYQRLYRITDRADETQALAAQGIDSAHKIAADSRQAFLAKIGTSLPVERAIALHARARQVSALALAVFNEHSADLNRTGFAALPRVDSDRQALLAANTIPDWQSLFGSFDACACEDCASVHSAAAYFVDILRFLEERGVRQTLFDRRPDLGDIELSCANTNTTLPVVDLVNEILEEAIAPSAAFTPFVLPSALEPDLALALASDALTAAFTPPLAVGARVEVAEPGVRWRIQDASFGYAVAKDGAALNVTARSRQTTGTSAERRATPQYQNAAAYDELAQAVYPWALPFDLAAAESRAFLGHLGVPRRDLIEALRPQPAPYDVNAPVVRSLAAEGLGLSDAERQIIADEPPATAARLLEYWDGATLADVGKVQPLLDRAGLKYAQLEDLLETRFVNPGAAVSIEPDASALDSCDTAKLTLAGLTDDSLARLHRFVKLQRKLGWPAAELDKALSALSPDPDAPVLTNEILVRLDHVRSLGAQLRLGVLPVLALWRPIDTFAPKSLYQTLFYNPAVFKPQHPDFALRADGRELEHTGKLLADHAGVLQAVFRTDPAGLALLSAKTDGALNLANLSLLYRHSLLAQQLRLPVAQLLTAIEVLGIDPFQAGKTEDTQRFTDAVKEIQKSGFDVPRLDYLLRHRFSTAASFVPTDDTLAQVLEQVRSALLKIDVADAVEKHKQQESTAIERIAAALGTAGDVSASLLARVQHGGTAALAHFLALATVDEAQALTRANAQPQFESLEKLLKIASVIEALELPASQLDWLFREMPSFATAPDPQSAPIPFANWFSLIQLGRLRRDLNLEAAATEAILGALSAVAKATDDPAKIAAKTALIAALNTWLDWPTAALEALLGKAGDPNDTGLLVATLPAAYRVDLLARLNLAVGRLKRLGADAVTAASWCEPEVTPANAKAIRDAAKSKYDDATWQAQVVPLQDALRDQQREALLAYLAARPADWGSPLEAADADDLYASFLLDVQMCSCQLTSRIKQAIGSVQLFAQRCLMGLEEGITTTDPLWKRWNGWMKNYRVWEANRKIWLYPENWIEPELRDDKSPFFKDLESELLQSDLDNDAAEQAVMRYLEKLHEVGQLEIVGTYEDEDKNVHVFGRTFHAPRVHYYRRKQSASATWTPWEKLELDIEGDHLIPVYWNRKLMLIWPVFSLKQQDKQATMPQPGHKLDGANKHWEIQLAWSEYQYGRWSGKHLSDPIRFDAWIDVPEVLFGDYRPQLNNMSRQIANDNGPGTDPTLPPTNPPQPPTQPPTGGGGGTATETEPPTPVPAGFLSFKTFTSANDLRVRGYLRLNYIRSGAGAGFAYPFGEFRFEGCRKLFTAAPRGQMQSPDFAVAAKGTIFDRNWFGGSSGLTLLDGSFVPRWNLGDLISSQSLVNVPTPMPEDVSGSVAKRIDIPVLVRSPSRYKLLAPHQDPQFLANRPFFYMDTQRVFVVTSTGSSHLISYPFDWIKADLATLGLGTARIGTGQTPAPAPAPAPVTTPVTVLARGAGGTRVALQLGSFDLTPTSSTTRFFPRFWSDRAYTFKNFHHAYVCQFLQTLDRGGLDSLLSLESQSLANPQSFDAYQPTARVAQAYPIDEVEFNAGGAYDLYNWELFFHIPLLIATRLGANQRFEEAQRWFHYIFDPTGTAGGEPPQPYWRTKPFHDRVTGDYEQESVHSLEQLATVGAPEALVAAVKVWRDHPFDPYAVARLRTTAFQKTVVMKYLDNLIAWGDQRFRGETIETLNEATLLYVLAAGILGRRPERIERKVKPAVQTFNSLGATGLLSNAMEEIELLIANADSDESGDPGDAEDSPQSDPPKVLYFCVQENDKLLGYWDTVADRLFKLRHCMNIEGQVRQLPLFEPPIDPALLVRAAAAGLSIGEVLSDIASPLPNYRFSVMLQKAREITAEVRNLGSALLAALEKKDSEALSLLRSTQEVQLQKAVREVRTRQLDEAETNIEGLEKSRESTQAKLTYFETRERISSGEDESLSSMKNSLRSLEAGAALRKLAVGLHIVGAIKIGSPTTAGYENGGSFVANSMLSGASALDVLANLLSVNSQLAKQRADYGRRGDEWDHNADLCKIELQQLDKQITAAGIRAAVAQRELDNHELQIENVEATDEFMRGKFTNQNLYQWMIGQIAGIYFQSYQLAYDLAKRAERCLQHELGIAYGETSYIRFGYWDSLKKGLLAGDLLAHDLQRLDAAYLDRNVREYELTRHVSILSLAPEQLIALKETGSCEFSIPESLFDLDTPGHFRRRLKMVNITIPCVTGPYAGIHCKATLLKSSYRQNADVSAGYERADVDPATPDARFIDDRRILDAIVTSSGQNDGGLFEPSMRDERYLPFEGAGAISTWRLELPTEFQSFNYRTISDVILHLQYTARDDGPLRAAATESVKALLATASSKPLLRLFSLRHEFPNDWHRFVNAASPATLTVDLAGARFPYFAQRRDLQICAAKVVVIPKGTATIDGQVAPGTALPAGSTAEWTGQQEPGAWTVGVSGDPKQIDEMYIIVAYTV